MFAMFNTLTQAILDDSKASKLGTAWAEKDKISSAEYIIFNHSEFFSESLRIESKVDHSWKIYHDQHCEIQGSYTELIIEGGLDSALPILVDLIDKKLG